jgi:hypothetical protein
MLVVSIVAAVMPEHRPSHSAVTVDNDDTQAGVGSIEGKDANYTIQHNLL